MNLTQSGKMNLTQTQLQTCSKPTAAELIKEIAETYVNERGWADVMEILPILYTTGGSTGVSFGFAIQAEAERQALRDKHCPFCGEELKRVPVEGYVNYRCLKCMEDWKECEVGQDG